MKDEKTPVLLSWSSGKDSAWALHLLRQQDHVDVVGLLTTVNEAHDRVAMHAVRRTLLEVQAEAVGVPLWTIPIPYPCTNDAYESIMSETMDQVQEKGITKVAYGDLFLEDIRQYREKHLEGTGITPYFPLWGLPTDQLARDMISGGLRARITCLNPLHMDQSFAGREFDSALLSDLSESIDPCGENGEFHTFAYDGPMFRRPLSIETGVSVEREGFVFADLLLKE